MTRTTLPPDPILSLKTLLKMAKGSVKQEIQGLIDRIAEGSSRVAQAFDGPPDGDFNSSRYAASVANAICYQLSRLDAESELQRAKLAGPGMPDPLTLDVAIYGISGIREQIDNIVKNYEDQLEKAARQSGALGGLGTAAEASGIHAAHAKTVVLQDTTTVPTKRGLFGLTLRKNAQPKPSNAELARLLHETFVKFSRETVKLQEAFRTAQPRQLDQLSVPIDELRATANWLHQTELKCYR